MKINDIFDRFIRKINWIYVKRFYGKSIYTWRYSTFWHMKLKKFKPTLDDNLSEIYFAARPNPGAGIGHQIANWIAGLWFSKYFGLKFAYIPFSCEIWEEFLGFCDGEKSVEELKKCGYKVRRLPKFNEYSYSEVETVKKIITSYSGQKIVLLAEQDQFYQAQFGVMEELKNKFYSTSSRKEDKLIYDRDAYNLAIHIRRGDIVQDDGIKNPNLAMRFQKNDYFINALDEALNYLKDMNNIQIYLFSQGNPEDYIEFSKYQNVHFCMSMGAKDSFLHMVYADCLITSKSSFSYKPALLNRGIKFCPKDFWHEYPLTDDWIILDDHGKIEKILENHFHSID